MSKFKVGDKVKCLDKDYDVFGKIGIITFKTDVLSMVKFDGNDHNLSHYDHEMKLIKSRPLKVGDKISYTGKCLAGFINNGAWYTVKTIYKHYIIGHWAGSDKTFVILPFTTDIKIGWKK